MKVRIKFRKFGVMKFIGHLDVMRFFQKAMRRAEIPIAFTEGYSPHMIMSFAQPLGIGVTSDGEYLDIELAEPIASDKAVGQLNAVMVEGMEVRSFRQISEDRKQSGMTIVAAADYKVTLPLAAVCQADVKKFMAEGQLPVLKKTKRSEQTVDIRPMIIEMEAVEDGIFLRLAAGSEQNLKPDLVMEAFSKNAGLKIQEVPVHYHRMDVYAREEKGALVTLESLGEDIG